MYLTQNGERFKQKNVYFANYICRCGNHIVARYHDVSYGKKKSCGCIKTNTKHGLYNHRIYQIWNTMIQRCTNPNHKSFSDYGGRGVTVCDRWLDVANFIEDMYPSFSEGLSIDRIDNNEGYNSLNCRWSTKTVQSINQKTLQTNNLSGYRGVSLDKKRNKFVAMIQIDGKKKYLGSFDLPINAAIAYDSFVIDNMLGYPTNILHVERK